MRRVVLESPYRGDVAANLEFARRCIADSLARYEAPVAGHVLYTDALDDEDPKQRERGLQAHKSWIAVSDAVVVYLDRGITQGMSEAIRLAEFMKKPIEYRRLEGWED